MYGYRCRGKLWRAVWGLVGANSFANGAARRPTKKGRKRGPSFTPKPSGLRLQVVLQADAIDQAKLLFQPVGVIFFGVLELGDEDVAALVPAPVLAYIRAQGLYR